MHIDKEEVVDLLRARGEHDKAASVACVLPRHVDPVADAGLLHQFDVNVSELADGASDGETHGATDGATDEPPGAQAL